MLRLRSLGVAGGVCAGALTLTVLSAAPASAHKHPTPVELDSPAVVFVQTSAKVDISLIDHNRFTGEVHLFQRTYSPVLATGSGFAVDPSGTIVTAGGVVTPDLSRATVFAVNQIFHERYGDAVPLPKDPFTKQTVADLPGDPVNERLQQCYEPNTTDPTGGCVVAVAREVRVFPFVTSQEKYGTLAADVLAPAPGRTGDVAVLRVGASSMPTVDLAQNMNGAVALAALGFTGIPSQQSPLVEKFAHFTKAGSGEVSTTGENAGPKGFFAQLVAGLNAGMVGGPVIAEKGQVVGLLPAPQPNTPLKIVDAAAIRATLSGLSPKVTPERGPADSAYENALHSFKNHEFAGSIPSLRKTLESYPGHFLAARDLAVAQDKADTAEDVTGTGETGGTLQQPGGGMAWWMIAVIVAVVVLLAAGAALLIRRGRGRGGSPATANGGPNRPHQHSAVRPPEPRKSPVPVPSRSATGVGERGTAAPAAQPSAAGNPGFCTNCGARLALNQRFCGWCGHHVG